MKPRRWEEVDPPGPMLRALCIGNDKYGRGRFEPLPSCGNDAERVAQAVRSVPNAEATCRMNLCDKPAMKKALIEFLDQQSNRPPRVLILYCSGHGVQAGDKLYFLPTSATPTSLNELQEQCLSHEEIFRCLAEWLEKIGIKDVMCLVVIDACRTNLDGTECNQPFPDTLEPPSRPDSWALCVATARTKKAYATGYADLSSFTQHFVSDECGLFEPNVPVRGALEDVCERLRTSSNARQDPAILGLQRIPKELCLFPKKSEAVSFDVCLCYRDADKAIALSIKERLQLENNGCSVFFEAERGAPVESKISNAICNSKIIAIIISSNTFAGIDKLTEQTSCDGALGRLLWQCEMALEVYEHRRIRLLPILCGQEDKNAGRFNEMDKDALCLSCEWMEGQGRQCRQVRAGQCAQKALRLLRSDSELARELNNKNLSSFEGREIPSLLKGRRVGKMLEALSELMPFELTDAKREKAVSDIVKEMLDMLDLRPLKRLRRDDSDQSESCTSISSSQDHQLLLRRQASFPLSYLQPNMDTHPHSSPLCSPSNVSPSQVLCNAVEQTFNHTGKRLRIHCDVTRIEVRWLCQRGGRVEDEEEDVWWPATICAYANREDRMGYPIWKIRYDKREGPWEDLDAHVSFRSGSVLVHEEKEKESTEKMSGKGHCQWRMNECGAQDNAEAILATGTKVKARWRGGKDWFAGKVAGINDDGTYFITYEIGGNEEAVSRELIRPQDDDTVANSNEEFWDICFRVFLAWDKFQILSVEKKSEAIDFFEGLREEIFSELVKLKDDRGRGADVGYTEIGGILDKIGFWKRLNDRLPNQPDFSGNNGSRLSSGPDCGVWRELVQGSGQRWRVQGNSYLHRNTLRERTGGVSSVSKYVRGKIQGWLSREDSEMAGEDDR